MAEDRQDARAIARRLTSALEARDLESMGEILGPRRALGRRGGHAADLPQPGRRPGLVWRPACPGIPGERRRGSGRAGTHRAHPRRDPARRRDEQELPGVPDRGGRIVDIRDNEAPAHHH
jgi:hypothetical protein